MGSLSDKCFHEMKMLLSVRFKMQPPAMCRRWSGTIRGTDLLNVILIELREKACG